jgi:hypothetical protein
MHNAGMLQMQQESIFDWMLVLVRRTWVRFCLCPIACNVNLLGVEQLVGCRWHFCTRSLLQI